MSGGACQKNLGHVYNKNATTMAVLTANVKKKIVLAIDQIGKNKCDAAKATLTQLVNPTKRAPNKFAVFVRENFDKIKKQNPTLATPDIMKKIAIEWKKQNPK